MSKALYNGYEFPALPEWDTTAYPYAYLFYPGTATDVGFLTLIPSDAEFVYLNNGGFAFTASHYMIASAGSSWEEWDEFSTYEIESGYVRYIWKPAGTDDSDVTTIWSNFDIYSQSGELLLAASEPVPIEEEKGFDLKSWLTGLALGLSGKPLPLSTPEEPDKEPIIEPWAEQNGDVLFLYGSYQAAMNGDTLEVE